MSPDLSDVAGAALINPGSAAQGYFQTYEHLSDLLSSFWFIVKDKTEQRGDESGAE
jgi:hypothetical protein